MKCYLCHQNSAGPFLKVKKRQLLLCSACGLVYVNKSDWKREKAGVKEGEDFLREYLKEESSYRDYFEQKLTLIENYKKPGLLLDVGCGGGIFLRCAKERGWKAVGIDTSIPAVNYTRRIGLDVKRGKFEEVMFKPQDFGVLTIFQTIEHVADPIGLLKRAKSLLKPTGLLVITTPDREGFLARIMGKHWFEYFNDEHLYFFNQRTLKLALEKAGFREVTIKRDAGRALIPSGILTRLFDYYYNQPSFLGRTMTKLRPVWTYLDWLRFREPAVNLVALAKKEER